VSISRREAPGANEHGSCRTKTNNQINQFRRSKMNTNRKNSKKVVRVVSASAYRRLDRKLNREKKQCKALRRMRAERDE